MILLISTNDAAVAINGTIITTVVPLFTVYDILLIAFAVGIWVLAAGRNLALSIMALMMVGNAINGLVLWNFFPMHMCGVQPTFTDTMHAILASNPFVVLTVGLGVAVFRSWFRFYSIWTILIILVSAILAFSYIPQLVTNQPTPWLGLTERISIYGNLLWQLVLAIVLLHRETAKAQLAFINRPYSKY